MHFFYRGVLGVIMAVISCGVIVSLDCSFSISLSIGGCLDSLLVVTALTMFIRVVFVPV